MSKSDPLNRDPLTDEPGAHPVGTGIGAAGGAIAGAAAGSVVGPAGTLAGAVVGAIAGGLAGKGVAEGANPTGDPVRKPASGLDIPEASRTGSPADAAGTRPDMPAEIQDGGAAPAMPVLRDRDGPPTNPATTPAPAQSDGRDERSPSAAVHRSEAMADPATVSADPSSSEVPGSGVAGAAWAMSGEGTPGVPDHHEDDPYWREAHARAPYHAPDRTFDEYRPAYRVGARGRARHEGSFEDAESDLQREWESARGESRLTWEEAKHAVRAAWNRLTR